ncbi:hypothetical protein RHMOL_Rhmol09G0108700 [Rhododendron molle]|uniref:Uncharacterized protein n=1 Tax=Rhododendron molle TaxID=49168 RepID=A0ACC0MCM5_RHOML|nr:hypothetical protein RHMOL_Rhmol09G0108700 [Rhododendron molle]
MAAIWRRGFPKDAQFREMERIELAATIQTIQLLPFIFVLFWAVLTIAMPRWFDRNDRLTTFWYWIAAVAIALAAFGKEYERRALQAFNDRWRPEE